MKIRAEDDNEINIVGKRLIQLGESIGIITLGHNKPRTLYKAMSDDTWYGTKPREGSIPIKEFMNGNNVL